MYVWLSSNIGDLNVIGDSYQRGEYLSIQGVETSSTLLT
jgi:hypothetical protein